LRGVDDALPSGAHGFMRKFRIDQRRPLAGGGGRDDFRERALRRWLVVTRDALRDRLCGLGCRWRRGVGWFFAAHNRNAGNCREHRQS